MNRAVWLRTAALVTCLAGWSTAPALARAAANPFLAASTLPFQAPRFDLIHDGDYQPAFLLGMKAQRAEIQAIAGNPAAPTFDNTITAMERSGRVLDRVSETFSGVYQANTNPTLDKVQAAIAPLLAQHQDAIYLDPRLFARVQALHAARATLKLDPEQAQLLEVYHQQFVHAGARLSDTDKATLRRLNTRLSTLETLFQQKLLAATRAGALAVSDKAALAGLDPAALAAATSAAHDRGLTGKWALPLQNTTQQPALQTLENRDTRKALFTNGWLRAERGDAGDTRATIAELAQLRARKAALLGYPDYASYVLYDQMARTPDAVQHFIAQLVPATLAEQKREVADIQSAIEKDGKTFKPEPWDWRLYAEQVRKARYDLDQDQVKPYFELDTVLRDGVFFAASQLYGISFKERKDIPVYNPDVRVFEVSDKDGSPLALVYFDYFKRDNKNGGAWMSNFVGQSHLLGTKPVIYNVANFTKPAAGQPALISFDDVTTMFHEFGHALHGMFADQTYPTLSGTAVARDFVEFPSQFNEHWALDPIVFAHYAKQYQTGAPMPQALVDKIKKAARFDQGYALGEIITAARLDMDWHTIKPAAPRQDVDRFEAASMDRMGLDTKDVPTRYRSSYFLHIWANGYAAGYYAYLWTEMLDDAAFAWFRAHGGLTRENGQRFRDMILSRGHTQEYGPMFRAFYGKDPDITPMLRHRGLIPGDE
ncbi:peptidyl-dipeptidase DCP [Gluconacetobacter johannae DSM 13595]|uniref:Dipeptidyl carboxypeptidase n=1 Tax=Gluconacetobacter johannae TaxID=112140 RepID=A0A7W4J5Z2_9PROT|nr:M3 family metallopeptidase [Gluconacetobacter johannae]MBB2175312.1 M3 family metallopeptidase [Gluconacetobacter johannae]GBQ81036.1 peptidyl-dipeptidase DCP [Gluconacetobacter johannae DSM 13595]